MLLAQSIPKEHDAAALLYDCTRCSLKTREVDRNGLASVSVGAWPIFEPYREHSPLNLGTCDAAFADEQGGYRQDESACSGEKKKSRARYRDGKRDRGIGDGRRVKHVEPVSYHHSQWHTNGEHPYGVSADCN